MPGILGILGGPVTALINGAKQLIGQKLQNDADRAEVAGVLASLEAQLQHAVLEADTVLAQAQRDVIVAEAKSESALARNWRPLLMLTFTFIVFNNYVLHPIFGISAAEIPAAMWDLLKIGVGGYILGRSGEKAVANWKATAPK